MSSSNFLSAPCGEWLSTGRCCWAERFLSRGSRARSGTSTIELGCLGCQVKTLGEGSFGSAHLGKHKRTKEERVIKVVEKSKARLPVEDIEKEIMVLRQVDHPHIIRLHEWYEGSSKIYLVMDAIKGGTLRDALLSFQSQEMPVEESWSRQVLQQVLQVMAYCHNMRIIHKDLKDENVMLLKADAEMLHPSWSSLTWVCLRCFPAAIHMAS